MIAYRVRSVSQTLECIDEAYFESHNEAASYAKAVRGIIDAVVILAPMSKFAPLGFTVTEEE